MMDLSSSLAPKVISILVRWSCAGKLRSGDVCFWSFPPLCAAPLCTTLHCMTELLCALSEHCTLIWNQCTILHCSKYTMHCFLYCKIHKLSLLYNSLYVVVHGCRESVGGMGGEFIITIPHAAPGQIVMHNKRSLHSNQKVQQSLEINFSVVWKLSRRTN